MQAYRPDIDGLRAVAVIAVVLFHAGVPGFGGGYLGVDVFFVISGYLITGILLKRGAGTFADIVTFYERRVRRIVPSLTVVLLASLIAGLVLLSPWEFRSFSSSLGAATAFVLNLILMRSTGYFAPGAQDLPLVHLWSLSVEEQFYIVYPLFLWAVTRFTRIHLPSVLIAVLAASFALCVWLTPEHAAAAFYFPLSRAWELLLGAVVAVTPVRVKLPGRVAELVALGGLALVVAPVALYTSATPWPGVYAAVPCLGTALLLALNGEARTWTSRALSLKPVVGIGLISYSLYLWHWPIFVFYSRVVLRLISPAEYAVLMVASGILAWLSWRFIERPFRRAQGVVSRKTLFRLAGAAAAAFVVVAVAGHQSGGFAFRASAAVRRVDAQRTYRADRAFRRQFHVDGCFASDGERLSYDFNRCFVPVDGRPNVLLWGDSHALNYVAGFDDQAQRAGIHLIQATYARCTPVLDNIHSSHGCAAFNRAVFDRLDARISAVILSARLVEHVQLVSPMRDLARQIAQRGIRVIVLGPSLEYVQPEPLYVERFLQTGDTSMLDSAPRLRPDLGTVEAEMARLFAHQPGISYISVYDTMCPAEHCVMMINGVATQSDHAHLTIEGSRLFAKALWPQIAAALKPTTRSPPPAPQGAPPNRP